MTTPNVRFRPRTDTAANWTAANPVLADQELGFERDTRKFKVGDGTTAWSSLTYWDASGGGAGDTTLIQPSPGIEHYIGPEITGNNYTVLASAADRFDLVPFIPIRTFTSDALVILVTTAVAGSLAKTVVYAADATSNLPSTLLHESGNLDCATTGLKPALAALTFTKGVTYWIGARTSSTQSLSVSASGQLRALFRLGASGGAAIGFRQSLAFATAAPTIHPGLGVGSWIGGGSLLHPVIRLAA